MSEEERRFDEMLDECYEHPSLFNITISPSKFLKENDPIPYRCGLNDWLDSMATDGLYDLEAEMFTDDPNYEEEAE